MARAKNPLKTVLTATNTALGQTECPVLTKTLFDIKMTLLKLNSSKDEPKDVAVEDAPYDELND